MIISLQIQNQRSKKGTFSSQQFVTIIDVKQLSFVLMCTDIYKKNRNSFGTSYTIIGETKFLAPAGQRRPLIYMSFFIPVASIQSSFIYNQFRRKGRKLTMVRRTFEHVIIAIYVRCLEIDCPKKLKI